MTRLTQKSAFPCTFGLLLLSAAVYADLLPMPIAVFPQPTPPQVALEAVALLQDNPEPLADRAPQAPPVEAENTVSGNAPPEARVLDRLTLQPAAYQDWREAAVDGLGKRLRTHRIRLNANGEFTGQLAMLEGKTAKPVPIHDLEIILVKRELVVQRLRPQANGQFKSRGLDPGVYDLIATGPEGFAAFSFQLLPAIIENMLPEEDGPLMQVPNVLSINALVVPSRDAVALREIINIYVPKTNPSLHPDEPPREQLPPEVLELENNVDAEEDEEAVTAATTLRWHRVRLHSEGILIGRVRRLHRRSGRSLEVANNRVFLLRENRVVSETTATKQGVFQFESVKPGIYSIAAAGSSGFAAFGFEAVRDEMQASESQPQDAEPQEISEPSSDPEGATETADAAVLDALDFAVVENHTLVRATALQQEERQESGPSVAVQAPAVNLRKSNGAGASTSGGQTLESLLTHPLWAAGGIGLGVMAAVDTTDPPVASPSGEDSGITRRAFYFGQDQPWLRLEQQ
ncbi:MAG: hypothetical protein VX346_16675 [Planctomycetota bacterium]|nr:hypothetical protein [Planctomycetota bacterium]